MPDSESASGQRGFSRRMQCAAAFLTQDNADGEKVNPFSRREEHTRLSVNSYRVLTLITWLLAVLTSVYYSLHKPGKHEGPHRHRLWKQEDQHPTPFSMNSVITTLYWLVLFVLQLGYVGRLFAKDTEYVRAACNVGAHFITHNLFFFGFIMLWVRGHFWIAEILLIINFFNLSFAYFRHPTMPRFIHIPVVSGPLAWNFVALYLCGATAVNSNSLPARILANIAIWGILVYGLFFLVVYKDYTIGFALSVLTAGMFTSYIHIDFYILDIRAANES